MLATVLSGYLRSIAATVEIREWREAQLRFESLSRLAITRPVVVCYWIEDVLPLITVAFHKSLRLSDGLAGIAEIGWVCDDTWGGVITACTIERFGGRPILLPWTRVGPRIAAVQRFLRAPGATGIAVDGHGPYGRIGQSFVRLLRGMGAVAVPIAVGAAPSRHIRLRARLEVPCRGSRIACFVGDPIEPKGSVVDLRERVELGMLSASSAIERMLHSA